MVSSPLRLWTASSMHFPHCRVLWKAVASAKDECHSTPSGHVAHQGGGGIVVIMGVMIGLKIMTTIYWTFSTCLYGDSIMIVLLSPFDRWEHWSSKVICSKLLIIKWYNPSVDKGLDHTENLSTKRPLWSDHLEVPGLSGVPPGPSTLPRQHNSLPNSTNLSLNKMTMTGKCCPPKGLKRLFWIVFHFKAYHNDWLSPTESWNICFELQSLKEICKSFIQLFHFRNGQSEQHDLLWTTKLGKGFWELEFQGFWLQLCTPPWPLRLTCFHRGTCLCRKVWANAPHLGVCHKGLGTCQSQHPWEWDWGQREKVGMFLLFISSSTVLIFYLYCLLFKKVESFSGTLQGPALWCLSTRGKYRLCTLIKHFHTPITGLSRPRKPTPLVDGASW